MRILGLDLGGTDVKLAVLEDDEVVETASIQTRSEDGLDAVLARLVEFGLGVGPADSVGVAVPARSTATATRCSSTLHGD